MAGTREGGLESARIIKEKYGSDFYKQIGAKGGKNGHGTGFAMMSPVKRRAAGRKGGKISKRHGSECACDKCYEKAVQA